MGWLQPVPPQAPPFGSSGYGLTRLWTQIKRVGNSFPTLSIITPPFGGGGPQIYPVDACPAPSGPEKYC